jgi:glutaredoxin
MHHAAIDKIDCRVTKPNHQTQENNMKTKARFYHAGCPVCVAAERSVAAALDPARFDVEIVHLGQQKSRVAEAEKSGVKSVPALVLEGTAFHINFGADLGALK